METLTYKTSTIFISTGRRTQVFRSMSDMPPDLRRQLRDNLAGPNCRTLIVADRRGREYVLRALQHPDLEGVRRHGISNLRRLGRSGWASAKSRWIELSLAGILALAGLAFLRG